MLSKYITAILVVTCSTFYTVAQQLSFRHLGIVEGMPSNVTGYACFDSTGSIWVATNDGLISYDGAIIRRYLKETHPALPVNEIGFLFCDSRNRIWVCTDEGLAFVNEQRRINKVTLHDTLKNRNIDFCFEVAGLGMIAGTARKTYLLPENKTVWEPLEWFDKNIRKGAFISNLRSFNTTTHMFTMGNRAMLVDFASGKVLVDVVVDNISSVSKISATELIATSGKNFQLCRISISSQAITKKYINVYDIYGQLIRADIFSSSNAANGITYISTRSGGLIGFDIAKEKFYSYRHSAFDPNSISSDYLRWVFSHPNGYLLVSSTTGLNYTNVLPSMFHQQYLFIDNKGEAIEGSVRGIGEDSHGNIWIKGLNKLFIWNKFNNTSKNISEPLLAIYGSEKTFSAGTIMRDDRNNMWVSCNGEGLAKFDHTGKLVKFLSEQSGTLSSNNIRILKQLPNKMLVAGTDDGLFMLHPETYATDSFNAHPELKKISRRRIVDILPDDDGIWVAVSPRGAAYYYNFKSKTLKTIKSSGGLSSDRVYCLTKDHAGNIYVGTYDGLNIINTNGIITVINTSNGLRHSRVENLVTDKSGKIWITNFNSLICYDPVKKSFRYFDERNGVSNAGFTVATSTLTSDGNILFSNSGILVVDPSEVKAHQEDQPVMAVHRLYDDGGYELLKMKDTIKMSYDKAKLSFYYLSNTLISSYRFFYRYKMKGLDTGWQQPTKNNQVTYNLRPGRYDFYIQASYNEGDWRDNDIHIKVIVLPPWWQTFAFRLSMVLLVIGTLFMLFRRRVATIKKKEAIKQQIAELEGKALRTQMNPHFIFNSLNAIQELIITQNVDEGYQYLSNFSRLLRLVLNNSEKNLIPLSSEIEMIRLQLSLESLRFKNSFSYSIETNDLPEADLVKIPPLLFQPYVENAVWHGLRHKSGEKNLWIRINEHNRMLNIVIEDNGVGRQKAEEIKKQKLGAEQFESKGTALSQQRINILNKLYPGKATVEITDLFTSANSPAGTKVTIHLPSNME